ncbi:cytochrome c biogenesis protein [Bdellovibrio sp. HCB209]|uniref:cytochrome c biogenesis protein n=1 Tax=Bdellovibrio sp. HCB209 TaxID=3394354 RepID=UPI0039B461EC
MKKLLLVLTTVLLSFSGLTTFAKPGDQLKYLPVQDGGRIKPYDSFSREMLEIVYGKGTYEGRKATEIILTWMLSPQAWADKKIFEVRNHQVLEAMKLPKDQRYFNGQELFGSDRFGLLRQELQAKRETKEKLNPYFQALQRLENQYFVFQEVAAGRMLKVLPPKEGDSWVAVADLPEAFQQKFVGITTAFVGYIGQVAQNSSAAEVNAAATKLDEAILDFEAAARTENPAIYDHAQKVKAEVHYNDFHPFRWAYVLYILAAIVLLLVWALSKESLVKTAWVFIALGFILHTYGFGLRMYIMERAPVSNMYETVIWVSWGTILFAGILELIYKFRSILFAGTLVAAFSLVIADFAPAVLDPTLQPLEPVLRSNYWLTIHVMTITISYAAFFLAFGLGDLGLFYYLRGEEKHHEKIRAIVTAIYRSMQIGVAFLAPGIILGGIWADYSWGRFWGWDPKETWALIALLGYLAVLHARYAGMIKNFGMVVTAIITFSLVIMAWYGVNFVLGAGLHSYGFGAGGVEYVSAFVAAHMLFALYVGVVRSGRNKKSAKSS